MNNTPKPRPDGRLCRRAAATIPAAGPYNEKPYRIQTWDDLLSAKRDGFLGIGPERFRLIETVLRRRIVLPPFFDRLSPSDCEIEVYACSGKERERKARILERLRAFVEEDPRVRRPPSWFLGIASAWDSLRLARNLRTLRGRFLDSARLLPSSFAEWEAEIETMEERLETWNAEERKNKSVLRAILDRELTHFINTGKTRLLRNRTELRALLALYCLEERDCVDWIREEIEEISADHRPEEMEALWRYVFLSVLPRALSKTFPIDPVRFRRRAVKILGRHGIPGPVRERLAGYFRDETEAEAIPAVFEQWAEVAENDLDAGIAERVKAAGAQLEGEYRRHRDLYERLWFPKRLQGLSEHFGTRDYREEYSFLKERLEAVEAKALRLELYPTKEPLDAFRYIKDCSEKDSLSVKQVLAKGSFFIRIFQGGKWTGTAYLFYLADAARKGRLTIVLEQVQFAKGSIPPGAECFFDGISIALRKMFKEVPYWRIVLPGNISNNFVIQRFWKEYRKNLPAWRMKLAEVVRMSPLEFALWENFRGCRPLVLYVLHENERYADSWKIAGYPGFRGVERKNDTEEIGAAAAAGKDDPRQLCFDFDETKERPLGFVMDECGKGSPEVTRHAE